MDSYKIKEVYEDSPQIYRALLSKGKNFLRVEVKSDISTQDANSYIRSEVTKMNGLFENALAPYPGQISDEIVCPGQFKPVYKSEKINNLEVTSFTGFLNQRLTFGACTEDQAVYKGRINYFYCPAKEKIFALELITPNQDKPDEFLQEINTVRCKAKNSLL
ncbi:MAG: hypothetical protein Q7S03_03965 [bacterium]|nr:hypothetical protein [bacterium]